MKVLLTGAAGFIGFHVARRLIRDGSSVIGFDNVNSYYDPGLKAARLEELATTAEFRLIRGDLANAIDVSSAFACGPYDAVIHLAAQAGVRYSLSHPEAYVQSNLVGFANILEACRRAKVPHLIYASSSSVYGLNAETPFKTSQNVDHPVSFYAATKKANELMAHSYSYLYSLPATGLRFFTVYGPWGRPDMAYFHFTESILRGLPIRVFNNGDVWRDFTYIDDIVEGLVRLLNHPPTSDPNWLADRPNPATSCAPHRVYNIGNHQPAKVTDVIAVLEEILERKAVLQFEPMQPGDVFQTYADVSDLEAMIGFSPDTDLKTGLRRFVEWYRAYYNV